MMSDTRAGARSLDAHFGEFEGLVARAEEALAANRLEETAVQAQVAASFAWLNHTGVFASERLEGVLRSSAGGSPHRRPPIAGTRGRGASFTWPPRCTPPVDTPRC